MIQTNKKWVQNLSVNAKMMLILTLCMAVLIVFNVITTFINTSSSVEQSISRFSIQTASSVAKQINIQDYQTFLNKKKQTPTYWKLRNQLNKIRTIVGAKYLYTVEYNPETNKAIYLVDGMPKGSKDASSIGEKVYVDAPTKSALITVLKGEATSTPIVNDPDYGKLLTAYIPLKDASGNVVGIMGMDTSAKDVSTINSVILKQSLPMFIGLAVLFMVIMLFLLSIQVRKLLRPIGVISESVQWFAKGNLSKAKETLFTLKGVSNDEIGVLNKAFHDMLNNTGQVIQDIDVASTDLSSSSAQLNGATLKLLSASQEIKNVMDEVSSGGEQHLQKAVASSDSIEDMSEGINKIAQIATEVSQAVSQKVTKGKADVAQTVHQVVNVQKQVVSATEEFSFLIQQLRKIDEITSFIVNLSTQTNLLALNASIEAHRVGEVGAGFRVVAEEVRNLAEKSKGSADQILAVIQTINESSKQVVERMEKGNQEVSTAVQIAQQTGESYQDIYASVERLNNELAQVSTISELIIQGSHQVTETIGEFTEVIEKNNALSEQSYHLLQEQSVEIEQVTQAVGELNRLAVHLSETTKKNFHLS